MPLRGFRRIRDTDKNFMRSTISSEQKKEHIREVKTYELQAKKPAAFGIWPIISIKCISEKIERQCEKSRGRFGMESLREDVYRYSKKKRMPKLL